MKSYLLMAYAIAEIDKFNDNLLRGKSKHPKPRKSGKIKNKIRSRRKKK